MGIEYHTYVDCCIRELVDVGPEVVDEDLLRPMNWLALGSPGKSIVLKQRKV